MRCEEQIARAREAVEARQADEFDRLVVDLYEHPTLFGSNFSDEVAPLAAKVFYQPAD